MIEWFMALPLYGKGLLAFGVVITILAIIDVMPEVKQFIKEKRDEWNERSTKG